MSNEISDDDKKRIENANKYSFYRAMIAFNEGAEYATRYEREQQAKEKFMKVHSGSFSGKTRVPSKVPYKLLSEQMAQKNHGQTLDRLNERGGMGVLEILDNIHSRRLSFSEKETQAHVDELNKLINDFEAERSEVRNKVIEQAIDICKDYEVGWQVADIIEKLNSLKTK